MNTKWTRGFPTRPGKYWFYGWLHGRTPLNIDDGADLCLVTRYVHYAVSEKGYVFSTEAHGYWTPADVPDLPTSEMMDKLNSTYVIPRYPEEE